MRGKKTPKTKPTTHSCTDVEDCCRNVTFRTSRVCHLLCHMTRRWHRGVQKTHFIHKELQSSAGEHIRSTFWWVDCDIADSSLLPVLKEIPLYRIVYFLYIQYPRFYIHTSALTIVNHFITNRNVKLNRTHRNLSFTRMTHRWGGTEKHHVWQRFNCVAVARRGHAEADVSGVLFVREQ